MCCERLLVSFLDPTSIRISANMKQKQVRKYIMCHNVSQVSRPKPHLSAHIDAKGKNFECSRLCGKAKNFLSGNRSMFHPLPILIATWLAKKLVDEFQRSWLGIAYICCVVLTQRPVASKKRKKPPKEAIVHTRWLQPQSLGGTDYSLHRNSCEAQSKK